MKLREFNFVEDGKDIDDAVDIHFELRGTEATET
eukprot:CAMPEP_0197416468 /NCGR_PEP_ID=MMETSP1170-20131217/2767_1 /TAXON_ID=54406 /ORGANISM="Sarcinochrysis sp, Strain CCMP770" /LENGTH=33 /DNA_ID= /DNA_START= /DNA_END= /DNA_ORIENTATION=